MLETNSLEFLKTLLATPSPSGYESRVQQVVRDYASNFADELMTDVHGSVSLCVNPGAGIRLMYAGHCDQIGLLVTQIDETGFIYAQPIGGWDPQQLVGQRVVVWTESGGVDGVMSRKAIHLQTQDERKQVPEIKDLWIDIGAADGEDAASVVRVGDSVTLALGFQEMRGSRANAPGMDDKTGLWVVIEAARRAAQRGVECSLYAVSTVQEEIGLRGARTSAFSIDPHVGIAVDVCHSTDCPNIDKRERGEVALGAGPVVFRGPNMNHGVTGRLFDVADQGSIAYQTAAIGRAVPNDANSLQINRGGVATGLVGVPLRYMHSGVETVDLKDLDAAANLLAEFACALKPGDDFTP